MKDIHKSLFLALLAAGQAAVAAAQTDSISRGDAAFTFTEAQLGENDNQEQTVSIVNSNSNIYASQVGYQFSPMRFRYRAYNQKYNEIYINGAPVNDAETGQFRYSLVGGLNQQTRNMESLLPFEYGDFAMSGPGGSNNYNFRPSAMAVGQRLTLSGANRNYTLRGMYTYNSGLNAKGWAVSANVTYRWANRGYVEGTFYNALSYFLAVQKLINSHHSLSLSTWGNPTERASQGASTDEMYWLANNRQYNPYWGYQNGKRRNSRVVNDFSPSLLLTWDWTKDNRTKLTTSLFGKYSMYKSTKLNYNGVENPQPDYYKRLPSNFYDVWNPNNTAARTPEAYNNFLTTIDYLRGSEAARQINFDQLIYANLQANKNDADALYYIQARHNNALTFTLSSTLKKQLTDKITWTFGAFGTHNVGFHYQTMDDLLGANTFRNLNYYAVSNYSKTSDKVQYDLNNPNAVVGVGDKFGYDYNIIVDKAQAWTSYAENFGSLHYSVSGRLGYTAMQRDGKMRHGLFADNSFGKSKTAQFVDGGVKFGSSLNMGRGHTFTLGAGYELRAPQASVAFAAPELNNDFAVNLRNERVFTSELGYQLNSSWLHANLSAYYTRVDKATEYTMFYFDDINSFSYNSITNLNKEYMGLEAGLDFKLTSAINLKMLGTLSDAKNISNGNVRYVNSTQGTYADETLYAKNMRESGTPLTATSIILSYHKGGWFIDLSGNWYDRIFLSYSPYYRYKSVLDNLNSKDADGNYIIPDQVRGHGGWMFDASIGRSIYLKHGSLSINLMLTNVLNNQNIVTGGYDQSRSDFNIKGNQRTYSFMRNPKKYYALGTNGMLNIAYKF